MRPGNFLKAGNLGRGRWQGQRREGECYLLRMHAKIGGVHLFRKRQLTPRGVTLPPIQGSDLK